MPLALAAQDRGMLRWPALSPPARGACPSPRCAARPDVALPRWLQAVLPPDTAASWEQIRTIVPDGGLLVGGTALTVHLRHRFSQDLDFFITEPFDPERLAGELSRTASFAITMLADGTLNGLFGRTKVQFLDAQDQRFVEVPVDVEGIAVAGLGDLLTTKLKVIQDRGEHRDYYDLKAIEQLAHRTVEEGLLLFPQHYALRDPTTAVVQIVRGLSYHDDLDEDPALPESLLDTTSYWTRRLPEIVVHLSRTRQDP